MISTAITSAFGLFQSSVIAAAPIASASPLKTAALVTAGNSLCAAIETERDGWALILDGPDPAGFAGAFPGDLVAITNASLDQVSLDDLRGAVGRITFNLSLGQIPPATSPGSPAESGVIGQMEIGVGRIGASFGTVA